MRSLDLELLALCLTHVPVPHTLFPAARFQAVALLFPRLCCDRDVWQRCSESQRPAAACQRSPGEELVLFGENGALRDCSCTLERES